jgi:hypothetical protein
MAGDWIKLRIDLQTHPKVVRILSATKSDKFRAIGGLHAVWSVFDTHSQDGVLHGYTPETLDHIIGWQGFSAAMISVGWLEFDDKETLNLPEFTEHNGKSGKRRAEDQKRKRDERNGPQSVRNPSDADADKKRTREEKRRSKGTNVPKCPQQEIVDLYNKTLPELPQVLPGRWDSARGKPLLTRWREAPEHQTLKFWADYFAEVRNHQWYMGQNPNNWTPNLDWLLKKSNFNKLLEKFVSGVQ